MSADEAAPHFARADPEILVVQSTVQHGFPHAEESATQARPLVLLANDHHVEREKALVYSSELAIGRAKREF
jgi:hypothetical protein